MRRSSGLALGLMAGAAADTAFGDPRTAHPVAAFGRVASALERRMWRDDRAAGVAYTVLCVGSAVGVGCVLERASVSPRSARRGYPLAVAVATWAVLGGASLRTEAGALHAHLAAGDLPAAREQLTHLVGRDPSQLDEPEIVRAVVESVAENTSDAVVAPLLWGAVAGIPGLLGYRAVNTLDAMVGYRSPRYAHFGWASARADDIANLAPARVTAALVAAVSGRAAEVRRVVRADGRRHPSPNAGWCEAAYAGALGVQLGGTNTYGERVEHRPTLGDGRAPTGTDIEHARELLRRVTIAATVLAALLARRHR